MKKHKGRIVEISKGYGGFQYSIQGIKKTQQPFYDQHFYGSNGSYAGSDETYLAVFVKICVYDYDNEVIKINIRDTVLNYNNWDRVTDKRILGLKNKLEGKKVTIVETDEEYKIENIETLL
jgi:hypothetical protein